MRPFGANALLASYTEDGPQLYSIDTSGVSARFFATAMGKVRTTTSLAARTAHCRRRPTSAAPRLGRALGKLRKAARTAQPTAPCRRRPSHPAHRRTVLPARSVRPTSAAPHLCRTSWAAPAWAAPHGPPRLHHPACTTTPLHLVELALRLCVQGKNGAKSQLEKLNLETITCPLARSPPHPSPDPTPALSARSPPPPPHPCVPPPAHSSCVPAHPRTRPRLGPM